MKKLVVQSKGFIYDWKTRSAVLYQLTVIGEAVRRLSKEFRAKYPEIPWTLIAGMRDNLIHGYDLIDWDEVKSFANHLHSLGKHWQGEIFGWQAEYTPGSDKKPEDSKMTFTPADFWTGESGIWFFSLMWEHGEDQEPVEFLDDRGIIK